MCPEVCKFCNEIVLAVTLAVVSGSFPKLSLILASVLKFGLILNWNFWALNTDETLAI